MSSKIATLCLVATIIVSGLVVASADVSDADAEITLTDGRGKTFTLSEPSTHIVTVGKGLTVTAIDLGYADSIVVCDKYSYSSDEKFAKVSSNVASGKTTAGGSLYTSGYSQLLTEIRDAGDVGQRNVFDMEKDVVFITVGSSQTSTSGKNADAIESALIEDGFKNVLIWYEITEYSQIVELVKQVSLALKGSVDSVVEQMEYTVEYIAETLGTAEKENAFYVTYTSSTFKVGNTGSLGTSLALAAGANVITISDSESATTYATDLSTLVEKVDWNVVIFADNSISSNNQTDNLRKQVGDSVTIVKMDPLWNNFCPESMDGVWTMACALYPDLFEGDVPTVPEKENGNTLVYLGAGAAMVAVIAIVAFILMRR